MQSCTGAHTMTEIKMLTADEKVAEIRRLYFRTTRHTIQQDLDRALGLLKSMNSEEERERATVYMEGLAQMRADWDRNQKRATVKQKRPTVKDKRRTR
jgi:hypothetical protein